MRIEAIPVELPLLEPWEIAQRSATTSPIVLVKLSAGDITGYGEVTPVRYVTGEDIDTVTKDLAVAAEVLQDAVLHEYRLASQKLAEALPYGRSARAGVEMAIFDAMCKSLSIPLYAYLGGAPLRIETDVTIPICAADHARELAAEMFSKGFRQFKIKVGKELEQDVERVLAVAQGAPGCLLNIDANQGFQPVEAVRFVKDLERLGVYLQLLEQPVEASDLEGLRYVTEHAGVPVFADEAAHTAADVIEIVRYRAATGVNVKIMKAGIVGALEIKSVCRAAGLQLMLGCMLESRLGQSAAVHVACGTCAFSYFDLDSDMLLADQPVKGGIERRGATLRVLDRPGLGCEILESAL